MTNDELNKPRQFWLDITTPYGDPCDFIREGKPHEQPCATNIHVIELAPMLKMMEEMKSKILELENYLYFNADNLCGDDLIGDQRFTKRFEKVTRDITVTLQSYQSFKRENGLE